MLQTVLYLQTVLHQQKFLDASWGVMRRPAEVLTTVSMAIRVDAEGNPVVDPAPSEVKPGTVTAATVLDSEIGKR